MTAPFVIFSLPRSRSAWLSAFLSYGGRKCGHDLAPRCASIAEFAEMLATEYVGTAETGAVIGWRAIRKALPDAKFIVIRRPTSDVLISLDKLGIGDLAITKQIDERAGMLDELSRVPGVKRFSFTDLNSLETCQAIFEYCLGMPFDWEWWESLARINIQVDVASELRYVADHKDRIEVLKTEAAGIAPEIVIGPEKWPTLWPDINSLGAKHFDEVEGQLADNDPYCLDEPEMRAACAAGAILIYSARVDGVLAGYCMWNISKDVERAGVPIALHGPWFVSERFERLRLGQKLFDASLDGLRALGIKKAFPHHRVHGRGAKAGSFFKRRGAVEIQHTYSLWLGEGRYA